MQQAARSKYIQVVINKQKLQQTLVVLPTLVVVLAAVTISISDIINANSTQPTYTEDKEPLQDANLVTGDFQTSASYPASGSELNPNLFTLQLPPPPLDAMPYDVRHPLSNGTSVPVKKRWLWVPPGQAIVVKENGDEVDIPEGTMWWKEFYLETDRGVFLIERRIIVRVRPSRLHPEGWAFYSSHRMPAEWEANVPVVVPSSEVSQYLFQPTDWMPTQSEAMHVEIRFEDERGVQYPYVFPGQTQCMVCHSGAAGAYPNDPDNPVFVFGLHPNNLTPESFTSLVRRGWIRNGESLLTSAAQASSAAPTGDMSFEDLTNQFVGVMRNNCASCHNSSPHAAANFSAFIMDPNRNYSSSELLELLSVNGRMIPNAYPLVTPGQLDESELWLRLMGLEGRRRMPPAEGGLPDIDPALVDIIQSWIMQSAEY